MTRRFYGSHKFSRDYQKRLETSYDTLADEGQSNLEALCDISLVDFLMISSLCNRMYKLELPKKSRQDSAFQWAKHFYKQAYSLISEVGMEVDLFTSTLKSSKKTAGNGVELQLQCLHSVSSAMLKLLMFSYESLVCLLARIPQSNIHIRDMLKLSLDKAHLMVYDMTIDEGDNKPKRKI